LLRLVLDVVEDVVGRERRDLAGDLNGLINRHRADRHRRGRDDRLANRIDVAAVDRSITVSAP